MRTIENQKLRPNSELRFQKNDGLCKEEDKLRLFNAKDLEWLAWNWRIMTK